MGTGVRSRIASLWGATARQSFLAVVDQGLVSVANFATSVIVGRLAGLDALGAYTLGFTVLLVAATAHEALVAIPYTVYSNRVDVAERRVMAGSALVHALLLAAVCAVVLVLIGLVVSVSGGSDVISRVLWVAAAVVPFTLLREFARRHAFAELDVKTAVLVDAVATAVQLGSLGVLAVADAISPRVIAVLGLAAAVAVAVWYVNRRGELDVQRDDIVPSMRRNWDFGKWVGAARLTSIAHSYVVPWLLAVIISIAETGGYAAAATIIAVTNPLLIGVGMVLTPRCARAYADGGAAEVRRVARKATTALSAIAVVVALPLVVFGEEALRFVYGDDTADFGSTVAVLAFALVASVVGMGAESGLRAIERPQVSFAASLAGLTVTATLTVLLAPTLEALGGAIGVFAGAAVAAGVRCGVFFGAEANEREGAQTDTEDAAGIRGTG